MPIGQLCEQMPHCTHRDASGTTCASESIWYRDWNCAGSVPPADTASGAATGSEPHNVSSSEGASVWAGAVPFG